jgi:hypothetical protein
VGPSGRGAAASGHDDRDGRRYADRAVELPLGMAVDPGDRQPEAVAAYQRAGYTPIPVFPPYVELPFSLCFEKRLPALVGDQRRP